MKNLNMPHLLGFLIANNIFCAMLNQAMQIEKSAIKKF